MRIDVGIGSKVKGKTLDSRRKLRSEHTNFQVTLVFFCDCSVEVLLILYLILLLFCSDLN